MECPICRMELVENEDRYYRNYNIGDDIENDFYNRNNNVYQNGRIFSSKYSDIIVCTNCKTKLNCISEVENKNDLDLLVDSRNFFVEMVKKNIVSKQVRRALQETIKLSYTYEKYYYDDQKRKAQENEGVIFNLVGARGRKMKVYADRCVIITDVGVGSFLTGNISDGEKTIFYKDCIGIQLKKTNLQLGYLQLETASGLMNKKQNNFFNENTFTYDSNLPNNPSEIKMREVSDYIKKRIGKLKTETKDVSVSILSVADEIRKFKELLDIGALTQEEFDIKKKQLLSL